MVMCFVQFIFQDMVLSKTPNQDSVRKVCLQFYIPILSGILQQILKLSKTNGFVKICRNYLPYELSLLTYN